VYQSPNDWRLSCDRMSRTDSASSYRILKRNLLQYRPSEASAVYACWAAGRMGSSQYQRQIHPVRPRLEFVGADVANRSSIQVSVGGPDTPPLVRR
jgi:hypothetical protein